MILLQALDSFWSPSKCIHRIRMNAHSNPSWMGNSCSCEYPFSQQIIDGMDFSQYLQYSYSHRIT